MACVDAVQERLERQARWARKRYAEARASPDRAELSRRWLRAHPSGMPDVDAAWLECLDGVGPLSRWLTSGSPLDAWSEKIPLRCLLSSHPFMDWPPSWNSTAT